MTWARGSTTLPATQTPATLVRPVVSALDPAVAVELAAEADEQLRCSGRSAAARTARRGRRRMPSLIRTPRSVVVAMTNASMVALDDADGAGDELGAVGGGKQAGRRVK